MSAISSTLPTFMNNVGTAVGNATQDVESRNLERRAARNRRNVATILRRGRSRQPVSMMAGLGSGGALAATERNTSLGF